MRDEQKGANFAMCTCFWVKASNWVVASRTAALAAVRERPGSRTAVCAEATAQVSRAELSPELIAGFYFAFALAGLLAVTSGKFSMSS
jgi:hypothetical protein